MAETPRVLVIEDEKPIRELIRRTLTASGFDVILSHSGSDGLRLLREQRPDVIILDLNLPDVSGDDIFREIRTETHFSNIPIMILTGRNTYGLSTNFLESGADDYVSKPFDLPEFTARVKALLRRSKLRDSILNSGDSLLERDGIRFNVLTREVSCEGEIIKTLTPKEFGVLKCLVIKSPEVVSKSMLANIVWRSSEDRLHPRTLDVHVRRIRKKLGEKIAPALRTIPTIGYQWQKRG